MTTTKMWNKQVYLTFIENQIKIIMQRPVKEILTFDILDTERSKKNKMIALQEKQRQMKVGEIWQVTLGNYNTFEDLGIGHETGLDIRSPTRKIIAELKNRTNTDNASSRKANRDKLVRFKQQHPDYECIYGMINDTTAEKTLQGAIKTVQHDGVEIKEYVGMEFIRYILGEDTESLIEFVKQNIDQYG
jgi:hypothetical protein